jgi:hypothetical protein
MGRWKETSRCLRLKNIAASLYDTPFAHGGLVSVSLFVSFLFFWCILLQTNRRGMVSPDKRTPSNKVLSMYKCTTNSVLRIGTVKIIYNTAKSSSILAL